MWHTHTRQEGRGDVGSCVWLERVDSRLDDLTDYGWPVSNLPWKAPTERARKTGGLDTLALLTRKSTFSSCSFLRCIAYLPMRFKVANIYIDICRHGENRTIANGSVLFSNNRMLYDDTTISNTRAAGENTSMQNKNTEALCLSSRIFKSVPGPLWPTWSVCFPAKIN